METFASVTRYKTDKGVAESPYPGQSPEITIEDLKKCKDLLPFLFHMAP